MVWSVIPLAPELLPLLHVPMWTVVGPRTVAGPPDPPDDDDTDPVADDPQDDDPVTDPDAEPAEGARDADLADLDPEDAEG